MNASYTPRLLPGIEPGDIPAPPRPPAPREPKPWTVIPAPVIRPAELLTDPYLRHEGLLTWHLNHLRDLADEILASGNEESREVLGQFVESMLDLEVAL